MCGIVGVMGLDTSSWTVDEAALARMRDAMAHRGPDGAGLWISPDRRVGLGHRRLSIVDLSTVANQPMANEDGQVQVVFNGEIYNHAEIRAELLQRGGHTWKTDHSDTEAILHAYEEWGIEAVKRFRGMFAIGLWDARKRELWLVRDRVGIKPLYYSLHNGRLAFASEIKALLADPDQPRLLDEEAMFHYLSFLAAPPPFTLFAGIRKLSAGCVLRVTPDGRMEEHRYWDPLDHTRDMAGTRGEDLQAELIALIRTAVKLRKMSDVPVGVFLSGGVDSSLNALLFSEGERSPVRTFSIGYEGENPSYPSELPYARRMASFVNASHHEMLLNQQHLLDFLPRMIDLQDEPIADPVCVPVYFVSRLAREHGVKVCQVGEGADELFLGYAGWHRLLRYEHYSRIGGLGAAKRALLAGSRRTQGPDSMASEWLRRSVSGRPVFWGGAEAMTQEGKLRLLAPHLRRRFADHDSWHAIEPIHRRFLDKARDRHPAQWMTYLDLNYRLPELLHMRLDKMSMGVSLEAREPFLDHKLIEFALSIPAAMKVGGGTPKHFLKNTIRDLLPAEVLSRAKQGFGVPVAEWLQDRLGRQIEADVMDFARTSGLFDPAEVSRILAEKRRGIVWTLMNFTLWWKAYGLSH